MSARVPIHPPKANISVVKTGLRPSSQTWQALASIINWCNGVGATLIPAYRPGNTIAVGATGVYDYLSFQTYPNLTRMWVVKLKAAAGGSVAIVTANGGAAITRSVSDDPMYNAPIVLFEHKASKSFATTGAYTSLSLSIECDAGSAAGFDVESIACYEIPRIELDVVNASTSDRGVDVESLRASRDIFDLDYTSFPTHSIHAIAYALRQTNRQNYPRSYPTRMLACWAVPATDALTTTSATRVKITQLPVPFLPKRGLVKRYTPSASVRFLFHAKVTGTGNALCDFRVGEVEDVSGGIWSSASLNGTSYAWVDNFASVSRQEEMAQADGRVLDGATPKWSEFEIAIRRNTATSIELKSFCVIDEGS